MLIIILVLLLIFGGGFGGYYGYNRYGQRGGISIIGFVILIIVLLWLFGGGGFHMHEFRDYLEERGRDTAGWRGHIEDYKNRELGSAPTTGCRLELVRDGPAVRG